jgi:hypothetical protein
MRPTSLLALAGLVVTGIIIADVLIHPSGTKQAAAGIVSIMTPAEQALLGSVPK